MCEAVCEYIQCHSLLLPSFGVGRTVLAWSFLFLVAVDATGAPVHVNKCVVPNAHYCCPPVQQGFDGLPHWHTSLFACISVGPRVFSSCVKAPFQLSTPPLPFVCVSCSVG